MYEHNGEKYFVVDSHMHYWDASPQNWVAGAEQYAKGWIECFHAYQSLGPPETHWSIEHFQKASEEDLITHCRGRLAHYKCPTSIEFRDELARTATGKLQKFKLRAPYWEGLERQVN